MLREIIMNTYDRFTKETFLSWLSAQDDERVFQLYESKACIFYRFLNENGMPCLGFGLSRFTIAGGFIREDAPDWSINLQTSFNRVTGGNISVAMIKQYCQENW